MPDVSYAGLVVPVNLLELGVSPNERVHWAVKAKRNANVRDITRINAGMWLRTFNAVGTWMGRSLRCRVEIRVVLGKGRRTRDADNLIAALKPCLDGLKDAGIIRDDTPEWIESTVPSQTRGTDPLFTRVVFTITPLGGAPDER